MIGEHAGQAFLERDLIFGMVKLYDVYIGRVVFMQGGHEHESELEQDIGVERRGVESKVCNMRALVYETRLCSIEISEK